MRKKVKITVVKKFDGKVIYGGKMPTTPKYPLVARATKWKRVEFSL